MWWLTNLLGGPKRVNHAAAAIDERIYTFGGYCTGEDYKAARPIDVHILNTVTFRWKAVPKLKSMRVEIPFQRYGHTANAYGHLIYIWGGRNDMCACNRIYSYNTENNSWVKVTPKGKSPSARDGHTACIIQDKMYIVGGFEEEMSQFSDDVYALDLKSVTWFRITASGVPPSRRDFHSATAIGDRMYIFGGRSGTTNLLAGDEFYCNQIICYDTKTNSWSDEPTVGDVPPGRRSHSAFVYEKELYIFGGYNAILGIHYNEIYKFNPSSRQWKLMICSGKLPAARRRQCCCVVGRRLFMFGGTSPYSPSSSLSQYLLSAIDRTNLVDHSDLNVLDFFPSLKTMCQMIVIRCGLDQSVLPRDVRWELNYLTADNTISCILNKNG